MTKRITEAVDVKNKVPHVLSASAIARQFWCEMQVDLRRKYGDIEKPERERERERERGRGKEIHKELLLEISEVIPGKVKTPVDLLYSIEAVPQINPNSRPSI
ncbi:MAG: hypothetical protein EFT35_08675 [Methanophagales archaeon ANME-1-THS]|nr:MAG: hypothetical protein EFT35_08675 [Methanophagales archaeon ANME-1-THS]